MDKFINRSLHRYANLFVCMRSQKSLVNFTKAQCFHGGTKKAMLSTRGPYFTQLRTVTKKKPFEDTSKDGPVGWKGALVVVLIGGAYMYYFKSVQWKQEEERKNQRTKALGKAVLGGDWEMVDMYGKTRTNKDWHGKWVLLYFGFTHCPDICPEELEKLTEVVDGIDAEKSVPNVSPLFVTVDPERDTPEAIKTYCAEYSPKLLGLTGNDAQLRQLTRAYRVYFSSGPKDSDNDYIVDHTIITYLLNPKGEFVDYYGQNKTPSEMKNSIVHHMYRYEAENK